MKPYFTIDQVTVGGDASLLIIAGPCVLEDEATSLQIGQALKEQCAKLGLSYIFKASFDKANRSSIDAPRGPGLEKGLTLLHDIGEKLGVPVTTDVHETWQVPEAAKVVDLIQIPAFLARQTDLLVAAASTGRAINVKKGQFMAPAEMSGPIQKIKQAGGQDIMLTERGTFFGYQRLVNDFVGFADMAQHGCPLCFDVTHSTQMPAANTTEAGSRSSGGRPDRAPQLARAAVAVGSDALFIETHPEPSQALSDAASMLPLDQTLALLQQLADLHRMIIRGINADT